MRLGPCPDQPPIAASERWGSATAVVTPSEERTWAASYIGRLGPSSPNCGAESNTTMLPLLFALLSKFNRDANAPPPPASHTCPPISTNSASVLVRPGPDIARSAVIGVTAGSAALTVAKFPSTSHSTWR